MTDFNVRLQGQKKFRVTVKSGGVPMSVSSGDLADFDLTNVNDQYVLMYDASTQKWKAVNPDAVFSAAATTETIQPGLPADFINTLDTDLDNRIDLDGGTW